MIITLHECHLASFAKAAIHHPSLFAPQEASLLEAARAAVGARRLVRVCTHCAPVRGNCRFVLSFCCPLAVLNHVRSKWRK